MENRLLLIVWILQGPLLLIGQSGILTSGGTYSGGGGSISQSVGQVSYVYDDGSGGNSLSGGLQQASEVSMLPIELIYFRAEVFGDSEVLLSWRTLSEYNNAYFVIERSKDGILWSERMRLPGLGTTMSGKTYEVKDETPYLGTSYYRLKQVDYDGQYSYSEREVVRILLMEGVRIYPNPFRSILHVRLEEYPRDYVLYNMEGKVLMSGSIQSSAWYIEGSDMGRGMYILSLEGEDGSKSHYEIIKE